MIADYAPRTAIRRLNLLGGATLGIALGAAGGWAVSVPIAGAVIANGTIVEESSVRKVQHFNGGIVKEILVKEGTPVAAGQILVRLDDTVVRSTLGIVRSQLDLYAARLARLLAERDGLASIADRGSFPAAERSAPADAIAGEQQLFQSRHDGLEGQRGRLRERVAQIGEEIRGLGAQQRSKDSEITYVGEELASVVELYGKQLVPLARLKQLQRDQARLTGERGQLVADVAASRRKVAETELQLLQLDQDFRTDVLKDLQETEAKLAELRERASAAEDELKHTDIRAPQDGVVYQLQVHTIGGVIAKGETIMQIAPRADGLVVEAKIAPQDIDQVESGAAVRVRIGAGNRRTTPEFDGTVAVISPDVVRETPAPLVGGPEPRYYIARVVLSDPPADADGLQLMPGMPAEVYIRTQDRTPLNYLVKPLREQIARAYRER